MLRLDLMTFRRRPDVPLGSRASRRRHRPALERLDQRCLLDAGLGYVQTGLASSVPGLTAHTIPDLINPWGFAETPDGQFRVSANGTGESLLLNAQGKDLGKTVIIPTPPGSSSSTSAPNGSVLNTTSDFVISHDGRSAPAEFLFSTEDGTIAGWNPNVDPNHAFIVADPPNHAVFKLLAMASVNGANQLYATDFHNGVVDVFDKNFALVNQFTDPNLPPGYAPFGVKALDNVTINGTTRDQVLFVTFAKQDIPSNAHDDAEGVGHGFIDVFDTSGHFLERFATGSDPVLGHPEDGLDALNSPIGMTVAPSQFGEFSNALLVGNFGDSHVSAFDLNTGKFLGQLSDSHGNALVLNDGHPNPSDPSNTKGLWGIGFGNGEDGAATDTLFFAAGIEGENAGLFGKVTAVQDDRVFPGLVVKSPHFYEHYVGDRLPELNAVAASVDLLPDGNFKMIGVNQGRIDPNQTATYVFGIDRSGKLGPGPFPDRPGIRFDALVVVKLTPGSAPIAQVLDLSPNGKSPVTLTPGAVQVFGNAIAVNVPGSLLPSTGLPPSQYRFNYWPEDGQPGSAHIASFAPEFIDAPVGVVGGQHGASMG